MTAVVPGKMISISPLTLPDELDESEVSNPSTVIEVTASDSTNENFTESNRKLDQPNSPTDAFGHIIQPLMSTIPSALMMHHEMGRTISKIEEQEEQETDNKQTATSTSEESALNEIPYEPLLSSGEQSDSTVATDDVTIGSSSQSNAETTDERGGDLSDVENVDLSVFSEDSLEAMYYSLRKNEIELDRMQDKRNSIKSAKDDLENIKANTTNDNDPKPLEIHLSNDDNTNFTLDSHGETSQHYETSKKPENDDEIIEKESSTDNKIHDEIADFVNFDKDANILEKEFDGAENTMNDENEKEEVKERPKNSRFYCCHAGRPVATPSDSEKNEHLEDALREDIQHEIIDPIISDAVDSIERETNSKDVNKSSPSELATIIEGDIHLEAPHQLDETEQSTEDSADPQSTSETTSSNKNIPVSDEVNQGSGTDDSHIQTTTLVPENVDPIETSNQHTNPAEIVGNTTTAVESNEQAIHSDAETFRTSPSPTNPVAFAMRKQQQLLDRLHGSHTDESMDVFNDDMDISERPNIRRNMWTSSVSETDSDYVDLGAHQRRLIKDDFNISTAYGHQPLTSSSSTGSSDATTTIDSAATRIQAGARGFLARKRFRRFSVATTMGAQTIVDASGIGTMLDENEMGESVQQARSFGNAAIDESLEDMVVQHELVTMAQAARVIQRFYRRHRLLKHAEEATDASIVPNVDRNHADINVDNESNDERNRLNNQHNEDDSKAAADNEEDDDDAVVAHEQERIAENTISVNISPATKPQSDVLETMKIASNDAQSAPTNQLSIVNGGNVGIAIVGPDGTSHHSSGSSSRIDDDVSAAVRSSADARRRLDSEEAHQQRRLTLQRGDAVQRNSTPDEEAEVGISMHEPAEVMMESSTMKSVPAATAAHIAVPAKTNSEFTVYRSKTTISLLLYTLILFPIFHRSHAPPAHLDLKRRRLLGMRQNSMPVQIDSEFMRILPKHLRKRIKSAETDKRVGK